MRSWEPLGVSGSVGLERSLGICISTKSPRDTDAASLETTLPEYEPHYSPLNESDRLRGKFTST